MLQEEMASYDLDIAARLGIEEVLLCNDESGTALALAASQEALTLAELDAAQLDLIVDYSILPQEYLVPAWNMSNKLQHELGAKKALTVGFSGGGATNFLVALSSAVALLRANEQYTTALLVAADITIPGNRLLNPASPTTIMGDSAGAMVLRKGIEGNVVLDTEIRSHGSYHDVCYIPGGALAHPDEPELYRMQLDQERFNCAPKMQTLGNILDVLLARNDLAHGDIAFALYPNLSTVDQEEFTEGLGFRSNQIDTHNLRTHGHLQGTDFVVNYLSMIASAGLAKGQYYVAASHGMGFLAGVSLFRC